jgi:hypothetical protein
MIDVHDTCLHSLDVSDSTSDDALCPRLEPALDLRTRAILAGMGKLYGLEFGVMGVLQQIHEKRWPLVLTVPNEVAVSLQPQSRCSKLSYPNGERCTRTTSAPEGEATYPVLLSIGAVRDESGRLEVLSNLRLYKYLFYVHSTIRLCPSSSHPNKTSR